MEELFNLLQELNIQKEKIKVEKNFIDVYQNVYINDSYFFEKINKIKNLGFNFRYLYGNLKIEFMEMNNFFNFFIEIKKYEIEIQENNKKFYQNLSKNDYIIKKRNKKIIFVLKNSGNLYLEKSKINKFTGFPLKVEGECNIKKCEFKDFENFSFYCGKLNISECNIESTNDISKTKTLNIENCNIERIEGLPKHIQFLRISDNLNLRKIKLPLFCKYVDINQKDNFELIIKNKKGIQNLYFKKNKEHFKKLKI